MFSAEQSCWFIRKVICWRAAASIAWAVLLLPPSTAIFVFLSKFSVLHPIQTISECFSMLTSATAIFSFILLCGVIIMVGFLNFEYYTVIPTIACSKIALFGQLLHPRQLVNSLVHCIMGMIVAWCSAVTIGFRYETLGHPCIVWILAFSAQHTGSVHYLNLISTGYIPRTWICKTLNLHLGSSAHPLDSIAGLLDLSLLYHLWISATFLLFTWYIMLLLFRIFLTEGYSFPVQSSFTEDADHCLPKVLTEKQPMLLKFLALQDLALLSQHSPLRRCEVFSLSQPGGHPHNWNAISKECLSLLADLTQRLVAYHDTVATNGRAKSLSSGSERKTSSETSGTEDFMSPRPTAFMKTPASVFARSIAGGQQSPLTAPFTPDLDSPFMSPALRRLAAPVEQGSPWYGTVQSPHIMRRVPKLWSTSTDSQVNGSPPPSPASVPSDKQEPSKPSFLAQFLQNRREQVLKPCLKLPEASSQALFADSQAHIWALEGLSYLVQASFSEDQFGVVQTTLPSILSCMLVLQEVNYSILFYLYWIYLLEIFLCSLKVETEQQ
uniref:Nucleoporin NDC1 n=1 Tax=Neolamprologus brichardi TaxID=32507 RepID=A0A3Q4H9R2_NEOBR